MKTIKSLIFISIFSLTNSAYADWAQLLEDCGGHENYFGLANEDSDSPSTNNQNTSSPSLSDSNHPKNTDSSQQPKG